jgi:hypothetical protein
MRKHAWGIAVGSARVEKSQIGKNDGEPQQKSTVEGAASD